MARKKMIYVSEGSHHRLRVLAARRRLTMGELVEQLVARESEDLDDPWLSPGGLELQRRHLEKAWGGGELDVYDDD